MSSCPVLENGLTLGAQAPIVLRFFRTPPKEELPKVSERGLKE